MDLTAFVEEVHHRLAAAGHALPIEMADVVVQGIGAQFPEIESFAGEGAGLLPPAPEQQLPPGAQQNLLQSLLHQGAGIVSRIFRITLSVSRSSATA